MQYKAILVEKRDNVAIITLNRPSKLNAISLKMKNELYHALGELEVDDEVKALVITGAGRAFSTGHDTKAPPSEHAEFHSLKTEERLFHFDKPVIAAVHGYVLGDGLQQALLCDMIIASENSVIGFIGAKAGGLCYGSFTLLPSVVGRMKANELLLTCEQINAEEACRIGLVNQVVPHDQLISAALEMARKIINLPPLSIKFTKRALRLPLVNDAHRNALEEGWPVIRAATN